MHAQHGQGVEGVGREVPVGHGVEAVVEHGREAEAAGGPGGIERQGRASQGPGPQRGDVGPAAGVEEPVGVPGQGPAVGQQVVGQGHGLGLLEMGVAGQAGAAGGDGPIQQRGLQVQHQPGHLPHGLPGPEPEGGGHLVVAAPPGVQLGPGRVQFGDPALHRGVDVLVAGGEFEAAVPELGLSLVQGRKDAVALGRGEKPNLAQHLGMGPGASDVGLKQPPVELEAVVERPHRGLRLALEAPGPQHRLDNTKRARGAVSGGPEGPHPAMDHNWFVTTRDAVLS